MYLFPQDCGKARLAWLSTRHCPEHTDRQGMGTLPVKGPVAGPCYNRPIETALGCQKPFQICACSLVHGLSMSLFIPSCLRDGATGNVMGWLICTVYLMACKLGSTSQDVSVRVFRERFSWARRSPALCWSPRSKKTEKRAVHQHSLSATGLWTQRH